MKMEALEGRMLGANGLIISTWTQNRILSILLRSVKILISRLPKC